MRNSSDFEWTAEAVATLTRLADEGLTYGQIALRLGCTRNAVIGKHTRLRRAAGDIGRRIKVKQAKTAEAQKPKEIKARAARAKGPTAAQIRKRQGRGTGRLGAFVSAMTPTAADLQRLRSDAWVALDGAVPVTLEDLGATQCKWPIGEVAEPGFGFCGLTRADGDPSYCRRHRHLATGRAAESRTVSASGFADMARLRRLLPAALRHSANA